MSGHCGTCRYWSEMLAQSIGCGPIEAVCLSSGSASRGKFVRETHRCDSWGSNHFGAVDSPPDYGETARAAYDAEEKE